MSKQKRHTPRDDSHAAAPKSTADDVASLINERRQFEEWIAALEAKRDQTPPHVFTRVHADYEKRLLGVVERLASHTGSLAEEQAGLKTRLEAITDEISHHQDERAEIELRAHVGELADDAVNDAYRAADEQLERLAADRKAVETDLLRVTEFFTAAGGGALAAATAAPGSPRPSRGTFDELSFLKSVVGGHDEKKPEPRRAAKFELEREDEKPPSASPKAATPPPAMARKSLEQPVAVESPVQAELPPPPAALEPPPVKAELPTPQAAEAAKPEQKSPAKAVETPAGLSIEKESEPLVEKPLPRPARLTIAMEQSSMTIEPDDSPRNSAIVKADESSPSLLDGISPAAATGEKPFAANVASNNPLSLKSSAAGDTKTLKCRECGATNDPSEWYCERCGAELSAM